MLDCMGESGKDDRAESQIYSLECTLAPHARDSNADAILLSVRSRESAVNECGTVEKLLELALESAQLKPRHCLGPLPPLPLHEHRRKLWQPSAHPLTPCPKAFVPSPRQLENAPTAQTPRRRVTLKPSSRPPRRLSSLPQQQSEALRKRSAPQPVEATVQKANNFLLRRPASTPPSARRPASTPPSVSREPHRRKHRHVSSPGVAGVQLLGSASRPATVDVNIVARLA